jgi:K+/H+ antiporter YhaU regulatory subunit KhtT
VGHHPLEPRISELTGCTVIAVQRDDEVIMDIPSEFALIEGDALYVCGTVDAFDCFHEEFAVPRG